MYNPIQELKLPGVVVEFTVDGVDKPIQTIDRIASNMGISGNSSITIEQAKILVEKTELIKMWITNAISERNYPPEDFKEF